jgi:hypothetical protein
MFTNKYLNIYFYAQSDSVNTTARGESILQNDFFHSGHYHSCDYWQHSSNAPSQLNISIAHRHNQNRVVNYFCSNKLRSEILEYNLDIKINIHWNLFKETHNIKPINKPSSWITLSIKKAHQNPLRAFKDLCIHRDRHRKATFLGPVRVVGC